MDLEVAHHIYNCSIKIRIMKLFQNEIGLSCLGFQDMVGPVAEEIIISTISVFFFFKM